MRFERKGQAGDVFRLMVDAIIGLVILLIILSSIAYFNSLRLQVSQAAMKSIVEGAVENPTGDVSESEMLVFSQGEGYSGHVFEDWTGVPAQCFEFESGLSNIKVLEGDVSRVNFTSPVETKVYVSCVATGESCEYGTGEPCGKCEVVCTFYFGKKPDGA